jgi:cell wall-associated NlpC family hydrolase
MGVFAYSPSIRCEIATASGTVDVSEDITQGTVQLRENGLHTMSLGLLNKRRKYDRAFSPNDRFVIYMKRVREMLVMTGYLNVVPFVTAWQRTIIITGSCANKRLLYHYWDPGTIAAMDLLMHNGAMGDPANGADGGISQKMEAILTQVCGLKNSEIHIGQIPPAWMNKIAALYNAVEGQFGSYYDALGGNNTQGSTTAANGVTTNSTNPIKTLGKARNDVPKGVELPTTLGPVTSAAPLTTGIQPEKGHFWIAMQWGFRLPPDGTKNTPGIDKVKVTAWLAKRKMIVANPNSNAAAIVYTVGWGPKQVSKPPQPLVCMDSYLMSSLGLTEGDYVSIAWVDPAQEAAQKFGMISGTAATTGAGSATGGDNAYTGSSTGQIAVVSVAGLNAANYATGLCNHTPPIPYVSGGVGPNGYDCSGLTSQAWLHGGKIEIPRTSEQQYTALHVPNMTVAQLEPGDLIFYEMRSDGPGHVTMWVGNNQMAEAPQTGQNLHITDYRTDSVGFGRPSDAAAKAGTTTVPVGSTAAGATGGTGTAATQQLITEWDWFGQGYDPLSGILAGVRSLMNDSPILPFIDMMAKASMRSWCAAPNGDFISWFPDYFGVYQTAGIMDVTNVELQDFTIVWSDESLFTHQFTAGTYAPSVFGSAPGGPIAIGNMVQTMGIATVQTPDVLKALLNLSEADLAPNGSGSVLIKQILDRFGVRPNFTPMQTIVGHLAEFWYALYLFQLNWASQFNTVIPITFMPELYPGMLLRLKQFGFQCYVTGVTHSFNLTQGGGFKTDVNVIAPSATDNSGLYGMAKGGLTALV